MAIAHMAMRTRSRAQKDRAHSLATYILRTGPHSADHDEVLYSESGHMPGWVDDPLFYWEMADLFERANGRLCQDIMVPLPRELDEDSRVALASDFAQTLSRHERLPYTLAIHKGDGHNPHCHMMLSERSHDGLDRMASTWFRRHNKGQPDQGGARKTAAFYRYDWFYEIRRVWERLVNRALEAAGADARIDCRSYAAQGIDRVPQIHLGQADWALRQRGVKTRRVEEYEAIERDNAERAAPTPPAPSPAPAPAPAAAEPAVSSRTRQAVARQLDAMGCGRYDIAVRHARTGATETYQGDRQAVMSALETLARKNAAGHNIHIRPAPSESHGLVCLTGLSARAVMHMTRDGLEPVATLQAGPGQYQAWVRLADAATTEQRIWLRRSLAEQYGADRVGDDGMPYSRLSGYTNRDQEARTEEEQPPFVILRQSKKDGPAPAGPALLALAIRRIEDDKRLAERRRVVDKALVAARDWQARHHDASNQFFREFLESMQQQLMETSDLVRNDLEAAKALAAKGYNQHDIAYAVREGSPELHLRYGDRTEDYVRDVVQQAMDAADEAPAPEGPGPTID